MKKPKQNASRKMDIVNVIPISEGTFLKKTLSYFTSKNILAGSTVTVELRKKEIPALVVSTTNAAQEKSKIRSAQFSMKKVGDATGKTLFLPQFVEAAKETAAYFATTPGRILQTLTPKAVLMEHARMGKGTTTLCADKKKDGQEALKKEKFVFQTSDVERLTTYKSLIREEFAKHSSVFFCLPTREDIEATLGSLERGIREYTFILHGGLTKKKLLSSWKSILDEKHPVLIIATGSFFSIPRPDIRMIIVDRENSRSYKTFIRPHFDMRVFAEFYAERLNARLILGDVFLRPETIWREAQREFEALNPLKFRVLSTARQELVDMKKYKRDGARKGFVIIGDELEELIKSTKKNNGHLFMFAARRGISSVTLCNDCTEVVECRKCNAPTVLHKGRRENVFVCHRCGEKESADRRCAVCDSWRLVALGIGIERVEEELKKKFPDIKIFKIDSDSVKRHKQGIEITRAFFSSPGSILLGTEMALRYMHKDVEGAAVVGIDSLFTIPDFRAAEKIFNILLALRTRTLKHFLIQTRRSEERIFEYAMKGNLLDFYRDEMRERKEFGYPPFKIFIKITYQGEKLVTEKEMAKLSDLLAEWSPRVYPSLAEKTGTYKINALLALERDKWIDENLLRILRSLPPSFTVEVDPESLL